MRKNGLVILHAEDDPSDAELVKDILLEHFTNSTIILVSNKYDLQEALLNEDIDVLLLDYQLSDIKGPDVLNIIKESECEAPSIIVTGVLSDEAAIDIIKKGAIDYVLKNNLLRLPHLIKNTVADYRRKQEKQQAEYNLQLKYNELNLLYNCSTLFVSTDAVEEDYKSCLDFILSYTQWDSGHIYKLNNAGTAYIWSDIFQAYNDHLDTSYQTELQGFNLGVTKGVVKQLRNNQGPIFINIQEGVDLDIRFKMFPNLANLKTVICLPIIENNVIKAIIEVFSFSEEVSKPEMNVLSLLSEQVSRRVTQTYLLNKLESQAHFDIETNLPNRKYCLEMLERYVKENGSTKNIGALVHIDIDDFKKINDSFGRATGDVVLKTIADRFDEMLSSVNFMGRVGVDEFLLFVTPLESYDQAQSWVLRMLSILQLPFFINDIELAIRCSVGIAMYPLAADNADVLLKNAEIALQTSKSSGNDQYTFYTKDLNKEFERRLLLENELKSALKNNEFYLEYQPQIDVSNSRILGFEALIRWNNPKLGKVSPADFIPIAEDILVINNIGAWVLKEAMKQFQTWREQSDLFMVDGITLSISINFSALQFTDDSIVKNIEEVLIESNMPADHILIEITESSLADDIDQVRKILQAIRQLGAKVSIDDFGTGYSSLNYLKSLPFDEIKIDQSFIRDILDDENDLAMVDLMIKLADILNVQVIAEGVETQEQLTCLQGLGCKNIQGFLLSKPLPASDIVSFVENFNDLP